MPEIRNTNGCGQFDGRGAVCIDTKRVLDCCRDRDCFEDTRVYLNAFGEDIINNATSVRTRSAKILWAYVGVDDVPFNCGFYQITVRYYIRIDLEACLGIGRSQCFSGIAIVEKNVVLYGGEGKVTTFSSSPENNYCSCGNLNTVGNNDPVAVVETVEPVVLGTKIVDCSCPCDKCELICCSDIPEKIRECVNGELIVSSNGSRLYVSLGIFSVIRIERPAQLLVQATDYSVPDKECVDAQNNDNPCALFRAIPFPSSQFSATVCQDNNDNRRNNGCSCGNNNQRNQSCHDNR